MKSKTVPSAQCAFVRAPKKARGFLRGLEHITLTPLKLLSLVTLFRNTKESNTHRGSGKLNNNKTFRYFFGMIFSAPPIYILSASGIFTLPSACRLFSRNAISILGGATTVLLSVWAR